MKKKVLLIANILETAFGELYSSYDVTAPKHGTFTHEEILQNIEGCEAIVSMFFGPKIDREIMQRAKSLKIISQFGVGFDNIDVEAANKLGITVTNTPDVVTEPTAELAMGLIYALARKISFNDRALREGSILWGPMQNLSTSLCGKTLGIIGMGRIGQSLARRAHASGMNIVYHNRNRLATQTEWMYDASYLELDELLVSSDVVSINAPANKQNLNLVGARELGLMKPTALLVNTARGTLVDEGALIKALETGQIAGAALDVYHKGDGHVPSEFLAMDNVVCVPHIGTQTLETREQMAHGATTNILNFFAGDKPIDKVTI